MKRLWRLFFVVFACLLNLATAQDRDGSFQIRFEPSAKLQTGVPVPFSIMVKDARQRPVSHAKVTLQIEDKSIRSVRVFPAIEVEEGSYIAKPSFDIAGNWSIYVEVTREGAKSARMIDFDVTD